MKVVRIDLSRVQTFLFAVPRLREMVGANVLLGETVRLELPQLANKIRKAPSLLALPDDLRPKEADSKDPLGTSPFPDIDDPRRSFEEGILSREAGHFTAFFENDDEAKRFIDEARSLLTRKLPGLGFRVRWGTLGKELVESAGTRRERSLADLPIFQVCQVSGRGAASLLRDGDWLSDQVERLHRAGDRFFSSPGAGRAPGSRDLIGLLRPHLPLSDKRPPRDFDSLCDREYLAVIHADGNDVGNRFEKWLESPGGSDEGISEEVAQLPEPQQALAREVLGERFFHSLRVTVRRALVEALERTFDTFPGPVLPYQLLMLGGDDLLLICRASYALPFLIHYARALKDLKLADEEPLTIGAGVAIAAPNVPFHHLHGVAEELAASAKRLHRALSAPNGGSTQSVADWSITTGSWSGDPIGRRRRESLVRYRVAGDPEELALTGRPYPILGNGKGWSLESLVTGADTLRSAARSQLRQISAEIGGGRRRAELLYREIPESTGRILRNCLGSSDSPWIGSGPGRYWTPLRDLVEIHEIRNLERAPAGGGG